jgi:hypothetical protein
LLRLRNQKHWSSSTAKAEEEKKEHRRGVGGNGWCLGEGERLPLSLSLKLQFPGFLNLFLVASANYFFSFALY